VVVPETLPRVDDVVASMLFRSVGELLTNVVKHATATRAVVQVGMQRGRVRVEVADDGVGFDVARAAARVSGRDGLGLFSIRERLEYLGGRMTARSAPGTGTTVVLDAPARMSRARGPKEGAKRCGS
jgi:signal transduction histidine kinase